MIVSLLLLWLVTAVSLYLIAQLSQFTGVEIDDFKKALISSAVFGLVNALVRPLLALIFLPATLIFAGSFVTFILNVVMFALAAKLVEGFSLRWGIWSAVIGALALSFINSILFQVLAQVGIR
ncbi:phage holin family protein [Planktothrix mougeotii]|uniref:Phage holin family protein n=1 Tax=Planktothrix mougeotii LEGE 06226 TaxID=1828728 RepID=A0ABR9UDY6_9CYAN|nr:phage holin family protein [Planktothrix mougeotii]MBE9144349.1 phage holin family protein [Planktothrix mougeotii LEGE 06226]